MTKEADEIDKKIDELIEGFKEFGMDLIGSLTRETGFSEKEVRLLLRALVDRELFKKVMGVTPEEHYLMSQGLTLKEARYVIEHPCLADAESSCSYYREHGRCVLFGCTNLNGWLYYKTSPDGKPRPNWRALAELPKDTLFIDKPIDKQELKSKLKDFLDETESREE